MTNHDALPDGLFERILDAIPVPVFVTDFDVRILEANQAARRLVVDPAEIFDRRLCGEVLRCRRIADRDHHCGETDFCDDCVIRNSVGALRSGGQTVRKLSTMELLESKEIRNVSFLVTVSEFRRDGDTCVLLTLEDVTELEALRGIIPICAQCKKIRNDEQYWEEVDAYLIKHTGLTLSHSICPVCRDELYPELRDATSRDAPV